MLGDGTPLQPSPGWVGTRRAESFVWHSLLGEPFPSFLDFDADNSYCRRPTLRAINDYQKPISEQVYRDQCGAVLEACGIFTGTITHQPRRNTQQKLLDKGVSEGNVQGMGFYASSGESKMNDSQKYSYINNPPVQGVCAAFSGFSHASSHSCHSDQI